MEWAQILVIILAILFSVFLIVAIVVAVLILRVTRQIKTAAASAERTVHALENSVGAFSKSALPLMVTKGIISQIMKVSRKKERGTKNE